MPLAIWSASSAALIVFAFAYISNALKSPPGIGLIALFAFGWACSAWLMIRGARDKRMLALSLHPIALPGMYASSRGQVDYLLVLRFLAAMLVFVMHAGIVFGADFSGQAGSYSWLVFSPAWLGMEIFFTLSGYLMGKAFCLGRYKVTPEGIVGFLDSRVKRLLPLMIVVFVGVEAIFSLNSFPMATFGAVIVFLYCGVYGGEHGLGAFWSLATEFQFYALLPVIFGALLLTIGRAGSRVLGMAFLILAVSIFFRANVFLGKGMSAWSDFLWHPVYGHLDCFVIGVLANWCVMLYPKSMRGLSRFWPAVILLLYLVYASISFPIMFSGGAPVLSFLPIYMHQFIFVVLGPTIASLFTASAIILIEIRAKTPFNVLTSPRARRLQSVLVFLGGVTYPFYLVHSPILIYLQSLMPAGSYPLRFVVGFSVSMIVAAILYCFVEPLLKRHWTVAPFQWLLRSSASPAG